MKALKLFLRIAEGNSINLILTIFLFSVVYDGKPYINRFATLAAYGGSQARGQIGASAPGLYHSHSNPGSEPHL